MKAITYWQSHPEHCRALNMKKYLIIWIILFSTIIAGCKTPNTYQEANMAVEQTQQQIKQRETELNAPPPAAVVLNDYYVNATPHKFKYQPAWIKQPIQLKADNLPFYIFAQRIVRHAPVTVEFGAELNRNKTISMDYHGTVQGALNQLAAQSDYSYEMNQDRITWSAFETKIFNISFMPGTSNYLVGQTANSANTNTQNNSSNGGSGGTTISTLRGNLGEQQYSNLQGNLSIWKDLNETLNDLKSPDGKIIVSEATTTVTVRDHPANVDAIARYIQQLNKDLSQQVSLKVEVLEIELNKQFNYGINWNLLAKNISTTIGGKLWHTGIALSGSLADDTNLATNLAGGIASGSGLSTLRLGTTNSNTIINALSQQGKLRVVTQPTVVTMNDQMAEIRITQDTGYLQSVSTTSVTNEGTTTSLTPGRVTDGFTLYLLPKIEKNKIYLQISSTISKLTALTKVESGTDTTTEQNIQVPTLSEKSFNQRTMLDSGNTLVITGFKQLTDESRKNALFGIDALGGKGAKNQNVQTIVLITPIIINNRG